LTLFAVNRSEGQPLHLKVALAQFTAIKVIEHLVMESSDPKAVNDADHPDRIIPCPGRDTTFPKGLVESVLPPFSWNVIRLKINLDAK
jgi:alpha-N-arabinofuranosidase